MNNNFILLNVQQDKYNTYLDNIKYNEKYKGVYDTILNKINKLEIEYDNSVKINNKYDNLFDNLEHIEDKYNTLTKKLKQINEDYKILDKINDDLNIYRKYKDLVSKKGITSMILKDKLPIIENKVNTLLQKYTNFHIKMELKGSGNSKKLVIYQIKGDKEINIDTLSGYEKVILNICLKIVIKNNCYLNVSNIFCIDEVLSCIAQDNYDKLDDILCLIKSNYNNIFCITHVEEIKQIINEHEGCDINIDFNQEIGYSKIN